jgi:hypothetical protein
MSGKVVIDGKVQSLKVDRNKLQELAKLLEIPTTGLQGIFLHVTAGRQSAGATGTASRSTRSSRASSPAGAAARRRK